MLGSFRISVKLVAIDAFAQGSSGCEQRVAAFNVERLDLLDSVPPVDPGYSIERLAGRDKRCIRPTAEPPPQMRYPLLEAPEIARRELRPPPLAVRVGLNETGPAVPGPLDRSNPNVVGQ